jgi:hypothetical protein
MKNKKSFILVLVMIFGINCIAQQKNTNHFFRFHSINNEGLILGQAGSAFQLQTTNGFQHQSWFGGVGIGLDFYRLRSIPLFADFRKEFGKSENKFFVFADAGINFHWASDKEAKQFPMNDKVKNGFYGETGIGYKIKLNQKIAVLFSGSYSYKKLVEEGNNYIYYTYPIINGTDYPLPPKEKITYNLNRLILKLGVEF